MDYGEISNQYENESLKEIPNTINIPFHSDSLGSQRLELLMLRKRIEAGIPFIPAEERKYYTLMFFLEPGTLSAKVKEHKLIDPKTGKFLDDVIITVLAPLLEHDRRNPAAHVLNEALVNRRKERTNTICRHLGIAPKHIERLRATNEPAWKELISVIYGFEDETLTLWGWKKHVYWNFERFIHIYIRHYKTFLIHESSKGQGTGFQYNRKDIRRIINIVLDANKEAIENRLAMGKTFQLKGNAGYYYNGDYYSLMIAPDGKLMQFHPQDKV